MFSTQLLEHDGKPLWIVNEGEFNMMNTLDLVADHSLYEMQHHPWTIRNVLDLYADRYCYEDEVASPDAPDRKCKAISFPHDMGVAGAFSRPGHSSYERPDLTGCFSYMTMEELLNWVLTAGLYFTATNDSSWIASRADLLEHCLGSMEVRDHPDDSQRIGVMRQDSSRCRRREITTYDCLDHSLGQASGNTYLASKTWAAQPDSRTLARLAGPHGRSPTREASGGAVRKQVVSVTRPDGRIPALVGGQSQGVLTTVVEGLAYAWFGGVREKLSLDGPYADYLKALGRHFTEHAMRTDTCIAKDGSWRITSSNANTFPAKIYVCQFVAERILSLPGTKRNLA